jgi:HEAT repeat protein
VAGSSPRYCPAPIASRAAIVRMGASAGAAFLVERFRNDSSYRAQAAAVTALGGVGGEDAAAVIEEAAAMASPRDIVARAARDAMGAGQ